MPFRLNRQQHPAQHSSNSRRETQRHLLPAVKLHLLLQLERQQDLNMGSSSSNEVPFQSVHLLCRLPLGLELGRA